MTKQRNVLCFLFRGGKKQLVRPSPKSGRFWMASSVSFASPPASLTPASRPSYLPSCPIWAWLSSSRQLVSTGALYVLYMYSLYVFLPSGMFFPPGFTRQATELNLQPVYLPIFVSQLKNQLIASLLASVEFSVLLPSRRA